MRRLVREAICDDLEMQDLFGAPSGELMRERVVSGDADSITARPFIVLKWDPSIPAPGGWQTIVTHRTLVLWVHDQPHDYEGIDAILLRLRALLPPLAGRPGFRGWAVNLRWDQDSGDLVNADRHTIFRTSTWTITGSGQ